MSSTEPSQISTSMPYISYVDLASWLDAMYKHAVHAFSDYVKAEPDFDSRTLVKFKEWCDASSQYNDVFVCDGYRLCRAAKLLMALGYGNFSVVIRYDIYEMCNCFLGKEDLLIQTNLVLLDTL